MPHHESSRRAPSLLLAVSGQTLIAAAAPRHGRIHASAGEPDERPPVARSGGLFAPYRRLFVVPGARAFTAGALLARLPMGMFSVSAVIMIADARGSYALAGAVTAVGLAASAMAGPYLARLVDRHGQARIAVPAVAISVFASLALLLCVRFDAPVWTLFVTYVATAATPPTGGMARARWAHLYRDDPLALHTATSFEQAADEFCFMLGPVLAALLCTTLFPEAGTLTGAVLLLIGVLLFAAQHSTEPPATPSRTTGARSPARLPGMPALLLTFLATGAIFGSMEVVTLAYADHRGQAFAAGPILALQALGSCVAGLLYGMRQPTGPLRSRFLICVAAMALLMGLPLLAVSVSGSLAVLACALLAAGSATAPTMATGMTMIQHRVASDRLTEGMALGVTALLSGIAVGSAGGGLLLEHTSATFGYLLPALAALLALLVAVGSAMRQDVGTEPPEPLPSPSQPLIVSLKP
ncbi:MFS transporter [Streptomyces sp. NPDC050421]|uniref:MFS transporter n=1 Tax=Streptomyces sp. NPDC050421 TaxID=3365613 RepID=UPI00378AC823